MGDKLDSSPVKYVHAVNLFKFCRKLLDQKYGSVRVIDQDVGHILGFDPADCSHWKKGKKNIRSIYAVRNIAQQLDVDEKLVIDVASGDIDAVEAYYEHMGYGDLSVDPKIIETAKKDYYRKISSSWTRERDAEIKRFFTPNEDTLTHCVSEIHTRINLQEAPLYLPEVAANYSQILLKSSDNLPVNEAEILPIQTERIDGKLSIIYPVQSEAKPYMRYRIAKAMAKYFLPTKDFPAGLADFAHYVEEVESHLFASYLLAPSWLVRKEIKKANPTKDLIRQLAETFWVSKSFMNKRLKDVLLKGF